MSNIYIQFICVSCHALLHVQFQPGPLYAIESVLYVMNFLSTVPSWICIVLHDFTLVVEHAHWLKLFCMSYGILWLPAQL